MENRISKLKTDFNNLIIIRNNVKVVFDILQSRINKLKQFYSDFIKNNKNKLFVFGLDSFHFQSKLIDIEYDDMKRLFLAINNRMYCEYFKLYKIITEYVYENIRDKKITEIIKVNNFPVYKDLEPYKEYNFETITEIHENILIIINSILSNLNMRENELDTHKSKKDIGLNIDNFITSFNYELIVMREKISMFLTYTEFFHQLHIKYLKRFNNKIQLLYLHISNDIKFDETIEMNKDVKNEINYDEDKPNYININNDDKPIDIIKEIKNSPINSKQINNILNNSLHDDNDNKIINKILSMDDISKVNKGSKNNVSETIKNGMIKVSSYLNMCSSKDSFDNIIDPSISDNEILDNFKSISDSCDAIIQNENNIKPQVESQTNLDINNMTTQIEEQHDISDVSTNDTLYSIKEEEEIKEELKEDEEVIENVQITVEVNEELKEQVNEELKEQVTHDEPKKKRTYKPRKKKTN
jgi:hypothetical protein